MRVKLEQDFEIHNGRREKPKQIRRAKCETKHGKTQTEKKLFKRTIKVCFYFLQDLGTGKNSFEAPLLVGAFITIAWQV